MKRNVGTWDRVLRGMAALGLAACAGLAPLPLAVRIPVFSMLAIYMGFTALRGTCFGYLLMGRSTCPASEGT